MLLRSWLKLILFVLAVQVLVMTSPIMAVCVEGVENTPELQHRLQAQIDILARARFIKGFRVAEKLIQLKKGGKLPYEFDLEKVVAIMAIQARQNLISFGEVTGTKGAELNAAVKAWGSAGRPPLTTETFRGLIDKKLNADFGSPSKTDSFMSILRDAMILDRIGFLPAGHIKLIEHTVERLNENASVAEAAEGLAREVIRSRYSMVSQNPNVRFSDSPVDRAFNNWVAQGKPRLTPSVLEAHIDPMLNPVFGEPKFGSKPWDLVSDVQVLIRMNQLLRMDIEGLRDLFLKDHKEMPDNKVVNIMVTKVFQNRYRFLHTEKNREEEERLARKSQKVWRDLNRPRLTPMLFRSVFDRILTEDLKSPD